MLTAGLYLLFFAYAISTTMTGPLIPSVMARFGISLSNSGLITVLIGVGGAGAIAGGGLVADKFPKLTLVRVTSFAYSAIMLAMSFAPSYPLLLVLYFLLGASTRLLDAVGNAFNAEFHSERRTFYMGLLSASYALGALAGPLLAGAVLTAGLNWQETYLIIGLFCTASTVFFTVISRGFRPAAADGHTRKGGMLTLLKSGHFLLLCALAFLYMGFSNIFTTWLPTYLQQFFSADATFSGLPVSFYWVGVLIGRLTFTALSNRVSTKNIFLGGAIAGCLAYAFCILFNTATSFILAMLFVGFLFSVTVPFSIALASGWYPYRTGAISSLVLLAATLGYLTLPWAYGMLSEIVGMYGMFIGAAILPVLMAVLSFFLPGKALPEKALCSSIHTE
jgi:FHS family glucose/mannose:H+ symporter-like MFS transporter